MRELPRLAEHVAQVRVDDELLLLDRGGDRIVRLDARAVERLERGGTASAEVASALEAMGLTLPRNHPRRDVLNAAALAALGISMVMLPPAARAASPDASSTPVSYSDGTASATFLAGTTSTVAAIAVQGDGRIVIGGSFGTVSDDGFVTSSTRRGVARFHPNGALDPSFADPNVFSLTVNALAIDPEGRIVVAGNFGTLGTVARAKLGRLHANGALDTSFANPNLNNSVNAIVLQGSKPIVGGNFTTAGASSSSRAGVARFHANGALDDGFPDAALAGGYYPASNATSTYVSAMAVDGDGRIVIGGQFGEVRGEDRRNIARLTADGLLDNTFAGPADPGGGYAFDGPVQALGLEGSGSIIAGGNFNDVAGSTVGGLVRLAADGTLDGTFLPNVSDGSVRAIAVQGDGEIVLGGNLTSVGGVARSRLARISATGALDTGFDPAPNGEVRALTLDAGDLLVGGNFQNIAGEPRYRFARLS